MEPLTCETLHSYQAYQLDTLLSGDGKELVIKFFNSFVTMQFGELNNLLDMAKEEMKKVMLINDVKLQYDDSIFSDYFTLKVMVLVNRGIYCRNNRTPESLKSILLEV